MSAIGNETVTLYLGDCLATLRTLPSVRQAVCDVRHRVARDERTPDLFDGGRA